jgi:AhpD family alkylhydroperoxidase
MRLSILTTGHRRRARAFLAATSALSRTDSPDIVRMLLYRPGFLTRALLDLAADAMRGPSYWTAAEREYLGMRIARSLECPFCAVTHTELVRLAGHGEIDPDDPESGRPAVHAMADFLVGLNTGQPDPGGIAALPDRAVSDALRVAVVWHVVNRLANAFDFTLRDGQLRTGTKALHRSGYRFPGFLMADGPPPERGGDDVANLWRAVLEAPATTGRALRQAAAAGKDVPTPWQSYVTLVREESHRITDADVAALKAAGCGEDEIFEVTVAAATGAALAVYERGRRHQG